MLEFTVVCTVDFNVDFIVYFTAACVVYFCVHVLIEFTAHVYSLICFLDCLF